MNLLFPQEIIRKGKDSLFMRATLMARREGPTRIITDATIEFVSSSCDTDKGDGTPYFWVIRYRDDYASVRFQVEQLGPLIEGDHALESKLLDLINNWGVRYDQWRKTDDSAYACGNMGNPNGPIRTIMPCHVKLIQHYGALHALMLQRLGIATERVEIFTLSSALFKLDGFLQAQYAKWDEVGRLLGAA